MKKRHLCPAFLLLCALCFLPGGISGSRQFEFRVSLPSADVLVAGHSVSVRPGNGVYTMVADEGMPELPVRVVRVALSPGMRVASVEAAFHSERTLQSNFIPGTVAAAVSTDGHRGSIDSSPVTTSRAGESPAETARYLATGYWHGRAVASVAVFPIAVRGEELILREDIRVIVRTEPDPDSHDVVRPLRAGALSSDRVRTHLAGAVINPGVLAEYGEERVERTTGGFRPMPTPSLQGSTVDYVIVTTSALAAEYQRLADWKTSRGVPTVVRTVEWILDNYRRGADVPETIRTFVGDAYAKWGTSYVLLGGDTDQVPARFAFTKYYDPLGTLVPVDMYYGCLDGTWNADHDGLWGEAVVDQPDLYPEVIVGRLPTASVAQVSVAIDKIIRYETPVDSAYTNKALFLAEVLFPAPWNQGMTVEIDGGENAEFVIANSGIAASMQVARVYENYTAWPGSVLETRAIALDSLTSGYNQVFHVGHGYRFNMHCGDYNITIPDADGLTNGDRAFNLYMLNCTAAAFDFDCLGEHFLNNANGGAVSIIGASNSAFPLVSIYYMTEYANRVYQQAQTHIGDAYAASKLPRTAFAELGDNADLWTHYIYAMLADPEMSLWTGAVSVPVVVHPDTIPAGETVINVSVTASGSPVDSAVVCLSKDNEDYQIALTGPAGTVSMPFDTKTAGNIRVVVSGRQIARYDSSIAVSTPAGALIAVTGNAVDDDMVGGTFGNGDGVIDAGEIVDLLPTFYNSGVSASGPLTAVLSTTDPWITVVDGVAAAAALAPVGTAPAADTWRIAVGVGAPDQRSATFTTDIGDGSGSWSHTLVCVLHAPKLELTTLRRDDTAGNGNGIPENGEVFQLFPSLKNYGSGAASGLTARLRSIDGGAVITDSLDAYATIGFLGEAENAAGFLLSETLVSLANPLELQVTDLFGRVLLDTLELREPFPPSLLLFDASLGIDRMQINWSPSPSLDVAGYHVYRSQIEGGPYVRASSDIIPHAVFTDLGLAPSSPYYYRVRAVDGAGNESAYSEEGATSTNPPQLLGWPNVLTDASANSPAIGDLDGDGYLEVIVGNDQLYAWSADGQEVIDGDSQPLTFGVFSSLGGDFYGPAALGQLDGVIGQDIAAASYTSQQVFCFRGNGSVLPGWPRPTIDNVRAGTVIGDLDGDGYKEILAVGQAGYLYAWHSNGTEVRDGDANPTTDGVFRKFPNAGWWQYQMPALYDIDSDGREEILIGTQDSTLYVLNDDGSDVPGWPKKLPQFFGGGLAIGDVDNNGDIEIIAPIRSAGQVHCYNHDGTLLWLTWMPQNLFFNPSPALADLTGTGKLATIIPSSNGWLYALDHTGANLPGWPVRYSTYTYTESSPIVADVDGDGSPDILLGDESKHINAWDVLGQPVAGFPLVTKDAVRGTPSFADLDRDGTAEIVVAGYDRTVYVWNLSVAYDPAKAMWPMFHGNEFRNCVYGFVVATGVADAPTPARTRLEQNYPNPFNPSTTIVFHASGPPAGTKIVVYSVTGARVRMIVDEVVSAGRHQRQWDGRNDAGERVGSGVYFYRLSRGRVTETRKMVLLK